MAEGWAKHLLAHTFDACSAGTTPHAVDPRAITVMREAGVDISAQRSKSVDDVDVDSIDVVITVCASAHESCPSVSSAPTVIHHGFDDPPRLAATSSSASQALDHYRRVRDEIRDFVETLPVLLAEVPRRRGTG